MDERGWEYLRRPATLLAAAIALALAGCGGSEPGEFPPAAEPAVSPAPTEMPAGRVFGVGEGPEGLVFDARTGLLAVGLRDPDSLALFDPARGEVVERIPLAAAPRHLGSGGPGRVLVPAERDDTLLEVSLPDGRVRSTRVGDHPHDAAAAAGAVFVSDEFGNTVSVVRDGELVDSLAAPEQPGGIAAVGDRYAVVVAVAERELEAYDARTLESLGRLDAGEGPTHIATFAGRAFVADTDGEAVLEFGLEPSPSLLSSTPAQGSPYGLAVDPRREVLWVTLTAGNELLGFALGGGEPAPVARIPTVQQPNSVAVDPRTGEVFVASRVTGELQQIKPQLGDSR